MSKNIVLLFVILSFIAIVPVLATPVAEYDLKSSLTYDDATLNFHIAQLNPYNMLTAATVSIVSGGYHTATPGDDTTRNETLTDGIFASNNLTVVDSDFGLSTADLVLEYTLSPATTYAITSVRVFAGHDGDGSRAWINVIVEGYQNGNYVTMGQLTTGPFGQTVSGTTTTSVVQLTDTGGIIKDGITKIRFSFYCVSDPFNLPFGAFTAPGIHAVDGTILKEIQVSGYPAVYTGPSTSVTRWESFKF